LLGFELSYALERMVTVMVISCPHALGLAIPLVAAISTSISANHGLLIRNRTAFENARKITTVIFDKTGTLTVGKFGVTGYESLNREISAEDILKYAGALEAHSEHPIASGILEKLHELNIKPPGAQNFKAITGKGIEGIVEGRKIKVVSPGYLKEKNLQVRGKTTAGKAGTIVCIIVDDKPAGLITLSDKVREESKEAITLLKEHGIRAIMATGDNKAVAEEVSKELGLDDFYAEVLPHQKLELIKALQEKGEYVAMTGDGINDAPALAQADVGIAVGSGTDVAAETADIILVQSNPKDIASLLLFGKATYRKMVQNLIWATGYNIAALPLAAGVLYSQGIVISPAIGAVFMSLSTIIVAVNAQLLKRRLR
jgi:Cu2+-exporting ATPase